MHHTNEWKSITEQFESNEIQDKLYMIIGHFNDGIPKYKPYAGKFLSILLAFGSTIYAMAYQYDNLTSRIYAMLSMNMTSFDKNSSDYKQQMEKFEKLLVDMPDGFKSYSISNGSALCVPDGHVLTIKKAQEIIDFIKSKKFADIMFQIVWG